MKALLHIILLSNPGIIFGQVPAEMIYAQLIFDSDTCCWRKLAEDKAFVEAAELIVTYLDTRNATNTHALQWHAGQMFALAGENQRALKYFRKTHHFLYRWFGSKDARAWYFYAKGVSVFLKNRNKRQLTRIVEHWNRKFPKENNYEQLHLLLRNWDRTYRQVME